ncbi:hypothetical protein SeMB42_g04010 [Synchytrium endobioticum]|uniref:RING-type domain-containing protein n=1 Tax=Synchytrium endobioticum TaxID=286115 RepID=A0A507D1W5_9FUNG|nr:hypothetical protein SeMB42_g04010 [Synchytrium endobioticum]
MVKWSDVRTFKWDEHEALCRCLYSERNDTRDGQNAMHVSAASPSSLYAARSPGRSCTFCPSKVPSESKSRARSNFMHTRRTRDASLAPSKTMLGHDGDAHTHGTAPSRNKRRRISKDHEDGAEHPPLASGLPQVPRLDGNADDDGLPDSPLSSVSHRYMSSTDPTDHIIDNHPEELQPLAEPTATIIMPNIITYPPEAQHLDESAHLKQETLVQLPSSLEDDAIPPTHHDNQSLVTAPEPPPPPTLAAAFTIQDVPTTSSTSNTNPTLSSSEVFIDLTDSPDIVVQRPRPSHRRLLGTRRHNIRNLVANGNPTPLAVNDEDDDLQIVSVYQAPQGLQHRNNNINDLTRMPNRTSSSSSSSSSTTHLPFSTVSSDDDVVLVSERPGRPIPQSQPPQTLTQRLLSSFGFANPNVSLTIQLPFNGNTRGASSSGDFAGPAASSSGSGSHAINNRHTTLPLNAAIPAPEPEEMPLRAAALKCAVCLSYAAEDTPLSSTTCGHIFCSDCVNSAVKITGKCPICRSSLKGKNCIHRLYLT